MAKPSVALLGVYALPVTEELVQQQADILYGANLQGGARVEAERQAREPLESTVLVEVLVRDRDERFSPNDFAQPRAGVPSDAWQVAWEETYLSVDGESRLDGLWPDPPTAKDFRVAFFIHSWDAAGSLRTSYGELRGRPPTEMPERLLRLVPYEPVD